MLGARLLLTSALHPGFLEFPPIRVTINAENPGIRRSSPQCELTELGVLARGDHEEPLGQLKRILSALACQDARRHLPMREKVTVLDSGPKPQTAPYD